MQEPRLIKYDIRNFSDQTIISVFELNQILDFNVKRIYTIQTGDIMVRRGGHAHVNQSQLICLLQGACDVYLFDRNGKEIKFTLDNKGNALFVPPDYWIDLEVDKATTLLCFASMPYSELISVYDKTKFFK